MGGSEGGGVFHLSCVTSSVPGSLFRVGPSFLAATFGRGCFMWTCCSHLFAGWSAFSLYLLVCHSLLHNYRDGVSGYVGKCSGNAQELERIRGMIVSWAYHCFARARVLYLRVEIYCHHNEHREVWSVLAFVSTFPRTKTSVTHQS